MARDLELQSERLKALGHPVRLSILRLVVKGAKGGTPAGEIQQHLGIPPSTLSHHLDCLASVQLLTSERDGTFIRYAANFPVLRKLTEYLWEDCCKGGGSCC